MKVKELIAHLQTFDPEHSLIGNFVDSAGAVMCPFEVAKVPGNNTMVVIQLKIDWEYGTQWDD